MKFNKFILYIILQVLGIVAMAVLFSWSIINPNLNFTVIYVGVIIAGQTWLLISTFRKNNRKIMEFLQSVKYGDTPKVPEGKNLDRAQRELYLILEEIAGKYGEVKSDKETDYQFFMNTIRHVNVGLIAFGETGTVKLFNDAAKYLLGLDEMRNIQKINKVKPGFEGVVRGLKPGKPLLVKIKTGNDLKHLSVNASLIRTRGDALKLISLQDIRSELQQEEIETWQKLISILRHEIMNSIGPINSLSNTLMESFKEYREQQVENDQDFLDSASLGLSAIEKRSSGLMRFVDSYRTLSKIPKPVFAEIRVGELLNTIKSLMLDDLQKENICLIIQCPDQNLVLHADEKLITPVLINVVKNAAQAMEYTLQKRIELDAKGIENGSVCISIEDNGPGIPAEMIDNIFIPFFTTKKNGSGIGLSLSRQIMQLHNAGISVQSQTGPGTVVSLRF